MDILGIMLLLFCIYMNISEFMICKSKLRTKFIEKYGELRILLCEKDFLGWIFCSLGLFFLLSVKYLVETNRVPSTDLPSVNKIIFFTMISPGIICILIGTIILTRSLIWYYKEKKRRAEKKEI